MSVERSPEGECIPGTDVVLCDAIAYLSGVNYGSVVKVLASLQAISEHAQMPVGEIAIFDAVPTTPVDVRDPKCRTRIRNTDRFVRALVLSGRAAEPSLQKSTAKFFQQVRMDGE